MECDWAEGKPLVAGDDEQVSLIALLSPRSLRSESSSTPAIDLHSTGLFEFDVV